MKPFVKLLIIFLCLYTTSIAQLSKVWEVSNNPLYPSKPILAQEYVVDSEGNFIVAGYSWYGIYNSDVTVFVMKIAPNGTVLWNQNFTQDLSDYDKGTVNGLFVDEKDNIILFAKFFEQKVIKYDKDGSLISFNNYDFGLPVTGNVYNIEYLFDKVHKDNSGTLHLGGLINDGYAAYSYKAEFTPQGGLINSRYDLRGDSLAQRSHISYLLPSEKSMFLFASCNDDIGSRGLLVSKLSGQGALDWTNVNWISNQDIQYQIYEDILRDNSGNFYLAIFNNRNSSGYFSSLVKLDPGGTVIWEIVFSENAVVLDLEFDNGGNIWVSIDNQGESGTILKKISQAGAVLATVNSSLRDSAFRTVVNYNNDVYALERKGTDGLYVSKYDWAGNKIEELKLGSGFYQNPNIGFIDLLPSNDLIVGFSRGASGSPTYITKITDGATSLKDEEIKLKFELSQNYPNPFNPTTSIKYTLDKQGYAEISVYDMLGRKVETLVSTVQSAGTYEVSFDGANLSSGTYLYVLESDGKIESKKMILIK